MNTEKLEKLEKFKKQLDNKLIPDGVKDKIRNEIENLESEIKSEDITATELKKEVAKVEEKVEVAVEKAEKKAESTEPKKGRGRPRKTPATTPVEPKATETAIKKTAMVVAKTIRKDGEKWNDAMKRANGVMKKEKVEVKKTTKSELDRLLARVRKNKSLMSELKGVKDLGRDAVRTAKPVGKRISESGNVYYEYRANKTDRKTYGKYAFAGGGKVEFVEKFTYKDGIQISEGKTDDGKIFYSANVISYPLQKIIPMNENKSYVVKRAKDIYKSMLNYKKTEDFKIYGAEKFELGGSVVTDLAGHTGGGNGGFNPRIPLDGFSNTAYTGLVGETGAMSSGEMFMSGGVIKNSKGEYLWGFNWTSGGFNDVLAKTKSEAIKKAKQDGYPSYMPDNEYAKKTLKDVQDEFGKEAVEYIRSKYENLKLTDKGFSQGLIPDEKTFKKLTRKDSEDMDRMANMMTMADGGSVGMANQQVIDDASQGYVNYYLGEGASQGIYKDGGAIMNQYEGRTPEDVWNSLSEKQREHFLSDHFQDEYKPKNSSQLAKMDYKNIPSFVKRQFAEHISMGQYAKGGGVRKVGNREYSYGRNWTNDQRHVNQSEEHEVNYTRKGKFLGVFAGGGMMVRGGGVKANTNDVRLKALIKSLDNTPYSIGLAILRERLLTYTQNDIKIMEENPATFDNPFISRGMYKDYFNRVIEELKFDYKNGGMMAKGGGVRQVGNREYSLGRNWTNDHRHINKSEEHEVNYNRKRFFAGGGSVNDDTPKIYVADLEAYNNGRLSGVWLDLTDYSDADELMDAINDFLKTTGGEEYAIHDYENLPRSMYSEYMGARDFAELYEMIDLAKENDLPLDVVMEMVSQFDTMAVREHVGTFDSEQDFAEQLVDDLGGIQNFNDFEYYLEISDTDRRLLSQEMADNYVDDIRDEDGGNRLIEEAGLDVDEYEEADSDRQEEMLDEAREMVYDEYYNTWYDGLSDPYYFLVEQEGLYDAESFANANFVRVDYEKLADALEQDYTFVRHDGQIYVFNIR